MYSFVLMLLLPLHPAAATIATHEKFFSFAL